MSSDYDATEFVDGDLEAQRPGSAAPVDAGTGSRAPTREEVDSKVAETQRKLAELKRAQEERERELAGLEETRRRQIELRTGREEMVHHLTRGLGLLEEAEFNTRRDAEQMAKALVDLRDALVKVQAINQETWTRETFSVELTRALTTLEHARMEWNSARVKFRVLSSDPAENGSASSAPGEFPPRSLFATYSISDWCRLGLALTGPLALVAALALLVLVAILFRR